MLKIETFVVNMIQENCYIVSDETHETVIIDCGAFYDNDKERMKKTNSFLCTLFSRMVILTIL